MLVNICMKFHEDTLNGFKATERTWEDIADILFFYLHYMYTPHE